MKKTHDYIHHHYRGYWSDGCGRRIRIYREVWQAAGGGLLAAARRE